MNPNFTFEFAPNATPSVPITPGDWEMTIRDTETQAVLAGPVSVTFVGGGVYGFLFTNAAGGNSHSEFLRREARPGLSAFGDTGSDPAVR